MKRTRIERRTPLRRSGRRIARVSPRRREQMEAYFLLRTEFLRRHPFCQVQIREAGADEMKVIAAGGVLPNGARCASSRDVHHTRGRVGEMLNATEHWMAVCRHSHEMIHQNPSWARRKGYLR